MYNCIKSAGVLFFNFFSSNLATFARDFAVAVKPLLMKQLYILSRSSGAIVADIFGKDCGYEDIARKIQFISLYANVRAE